VTVGLPSSALRPLPRSGRDHTGHNCAPVIAAPKKVVTHAIDGIHGEDVGNHDVAACWERRDLGMAGS